MSRFYSPEKFSLISLLLRKQVKTNQEFIFECTVMLPIR